MPTNRTRRARVRANAIDHFKLDQLFTGAALLSGVGYAEGIRNGCNHWTADEWAAFLDAMRADWARHGADVMAWWRGEHERHTIPHDWHGDNRENLRAYLARHDETEPFALREFGEPA